MFDLFLLVCAVIGSGYYWFAYFPKAWKDGTNREINDIKTYTDYIKERNKDASKKRK